jgi:hypothetical protein
VFHGDLFGRVSVEFQRDIRQAFILLPRFSKSVQSVRARRKLSRLGADVTTVKDLVRAVTENVSAV